MRTLIVVLAAIAVLVLRVAEAGKFTKKRTTCSIYT